jgi:hypothetical protein
MNSDHLQQLVTRVMPYGTYKGRLLADLPGQYLNWFAREGFPSGELGKLLALMQELDHNGLSHLLDRQRRASGRRQSIRHSPGMAGRLPLPRLHAPVA